MTKQEAKDLIGERKGWLGVEECGRHCEFSFYKRRPIADYAYPLYTEEQKDKAAEWLAIFTTEK